MRKNVIQSCRKSCNRCHGGRGNTCSDSVDNCAELVRSGRGCKQVRVRIDCRKSCSLC
jgi:hypothetical protein